VHRRKQAVLGRREQAILGQCRPAGSFAHDGPPDLRPSKSQTRPNYTAPGRL